jgi:hypothetical protein
MDRPTTRAAERAFPADSIMTEIHRVAWRHDIDALAFAPEGHHGVCVVHRLALRTLLPGVPTPEGCIAYFAAHEGAFRAAARAKILHRAIAPGVNFHLTSRDLARALRLAK